MTSTSPPPALFTDLYELTMAQAYWRSGTTASATFSLTFRSYPPDRAYFVLAGVDDALRYLENLRFSAEDIEYLRSLERFDEAYLAFLRDLRFTGSVRTMSEGAIFFAEEPAIEVTAPMIEAQIVETALLNQINLQTILATKASRVVHAARGKAIVDFAARRTHGVDAANKLARVSFLVGFAGTSNLMAAKLYDIPVFGTMAHSFVEAFTDEQTSFQVYADAFPDTTTLLVDTYDTLEGVGKAVNVAKNMERRGHALRAVRLDSGDLLDLSRKTRDLLDAAGLPHVEVFASGSLDEFAVDALLAAGAPIDGFGVGTKVGVSADAPWTDCVYKLVEYDGRPTLKLSQGKQTLPGPKQVYRFRDSDGVYARDVIATADEPAPPNGNPLLRDVMAGGKRLEPPLSLQELKEEFGRESESLPAVHKELRSPANYRVGISDSLDALRQAVSNELRRSQTSGH